MVHPYYGSCFRFCQVRFFVLSCIRRSARECGRRGRRSPRRRGQVFNVKKQLLDREWVQVAFPVQVYLDVRNFRGRGEEAAQVLLDHVIRPTW